MTQRERHAITEDHDGDGFMAVGPRVEELLTLQQEYMGELDSLGERQTALVEEERTTELLELLASRQRLIDGVSELNALLEPFRARWDEMLGAMPGDMRDRLTRRLELLASLAAKIPQRDEADRAALEGRRDAVARELSGVNRGRGALAAYGGGAGTKARFQDREA
jgi:hypothetical protein